MASLRAHGVRFARGGALLSAMVFTGCGITFPGNLPIGDDDPGVIGQAGRGGGAAGGGTAGRGSGTAGRGIVGGRGGVAGDGTGGVAGPGWGGTGVFPRGGTGGIGGGIAGIGAAGTGPVAGTGSVLFDRDRDGWDSATDCNDLDPSISPNSGDNCCDSIDNDCDGSDAPRGTACRCMSSGDSDIDGDGFTPNKGDCNEFDRNVYPGNGREQCCDGIDNDCDGRDDPIGALCDCATDLDGDGWQPGPIGSRSDCDDTNPNVFPGATELCDDGIDNDCDGRYDWMDGCVPFDNDGDGYPSSLDCNDWNSQVSPGAAEICNNRIDDNCDGIIDDRRGCTDDFDGDGWSSGADCNDRDPSVFPGAFEPCFDNLDSNCNGTSDFEDWVCRQNQDADGDGWTSESDCNEMLSSVNPGMTEVCGDGLDNDCDGLVDPYPYCNEQQVDWDRDGFPWSKDCNDGNSTVYPGSPYERCCDGIDSNCDGVDAPFGSECECMVQGDADGDGFGVGFSEPGRADCNDQDAAINPAVSEICSDGRDNNCNGLFDASDPQCQFVID